MSEPFPLPPMTNERLLAMAAHNRPPQSWYDDQEEDLFMTQPQQQQCDFDAMPLPPRVQPPAGAIVLPSLYEAAEGIAYGIPPTLPDDPKARVTITVSAARASALLAAIATARRSGVRYGEPKAACPECGRPMKCCAACERGDIVPQVPRGWAEGGE